MEEKQKIFFEGGGQAGTAAAPDWVVVLTRRDTKRFHVRTAHRLLGICCCCCSCSSFFALMVIGCWQIPVRLGAQEKRGAETTPTRETS